MKKTLLIFLLSTSIMIAYADTTNTQLHLKETNQQTLVHIKDTVITKPIDNSQHDIWSIILKFLPYTLPVIASLLVLWMTNRHHSKTTMKQIEVATSRKLIDDLINIMSEIDLLWLDIQTASKNLINKDRNIILNEQNADISEYDTISTSFWKII